MKCLLIFLATAGIVLSLPHPELDSSYGDTFIKFDDEPLTEIFKNNGKAENTVEDSSVINELGSSGIVLSLPHPELDSSYGDAFIKFDDEALTEILKNNGKAENTVEDSSVINELGSSTPKSAPSRINTEEKISLSSDDNKDDQESKAIKFDDSALTAIVKNSPKTVFSKVDSATDKVENAQSASTTNYDELRSTTFKSTPPRVKIDDEELISSGSKDTETISDADFLKLLDSNLYDEIVSDKLNRSNENSTEEDLMKSDADFLKILDSGTYDEIVSDKPNRSNENSTEEDLTNSDADLLKILDSITYAEIVSDKPSKSNENSTEEDLEIPDVENVETLRSLQSDKSNSDEPNKSTDRSIEEDPTHPLRSSTEAIEHCAKILQGSCHDHNIVGKPKVAVTSKFETLTTTTPAVSSPSEEGSQQTIHYPQSTLTPEYESCETEDCDTTEEPEIITGMPELRSDHPCRYRFTQHPVDINKINKNGKRVSEIQCEYNMWMYRNEVLEYNRKLKECNKVLTSQGVENTSAVVGGLKAEQGEFHHMGAVGWRKNDGDFVFMCGSSLISVRFAITAAHCYAVKDLIKEDMELESNFPEIVRFGSVNLLNNKNSLLYQDIKIDGPFKILPKYKFALKYNDVALIKLVEDVKIEEHARPACLWSKHLRHYTEVIATGWGATMRSGGETEHLRFGTLNIYEHSFCKSKLKEYEFITGFTAGLMQHQLCAGEEFGKIDTCQGDSGGPLQIKRPLPTDIDTEGYIYHVVGITSFGIKCGMPNTPSVYVNVSDHQILCWIEKTVWPEEPNPYCASSGFEGYDVPRW